MSFNAKNHREAGFGVVESLAMLTVIAVVGLTLTQMVSLIVARSVNAMELARQEDQAARFIASMTLAAKTATAWGIYADMQSYTKEPQTKSVQGNVLVCDSSSPEGAQITYVFVYDPAGQTLKRYENNMTTERMSLDKISLPNGTPMVFNQNLGLLQGHWQMTVENQILSFAAYSSPLRMR